MKKAIINIGEILWSEFEITLAHSGPENLKKVQAKNSWNQINQFHEKKFFLPNSIFCNFKNGQKKSIFELVKSLQLPKMQFHEILFYFHGKYEKKNSPEIDLFYFTSFLPGLF